MHSKQSLENDELAYGETQIRFRLGNGELRDEAQELDR
jgi:hypothetical protein